MNPNSDAHTIEITSLAHGGDGIGRIDGQVCFVPFALPGDRLRVRITRRAKNALWGEMTEILEGSPDRLGPAGIEAPASAAAAWLHFAYPAQAQWKQRIAEDLLARFGGVTVTGEWREDPALRLGYRTRAEFHGDGHALGYFAPGSHHIVDTPSCPLCHDRVNAALAQLRAVKVTGSVTLTADPEGDALLVWCNSAAPAVRKILPDAQWPSLPESRAMFLFDGAPIVNGTFSQSSLLLNRLLTATVREMAGKRARVLDLYCGNGNLSLGLAEPAEVEGYDHQRQAVSAANDLGRGRYRVGDEARMAAAITAERWDAILLDPPRTGAKALVPALARAQADRIIYVSCDPATLARDLKGLCAHGWKPARCVFLDLFPNTPHIESVCCLTR